MCRKATDEGTITWMTTRVRAPHGHMNDGVISRKSVVGGVRCMVSFSIIGRLMGGKPGGN